ncbi:type II toxin-antitoxin system PemK/MazF family toxin [Sinorhizobium meliloti]|jgi:mRNA-degrading endonuclease toxin of MazEF toxin-antitoxin module|nr:hypothetical protein SMB554_31930 [Sinorhizobium meliloti]ASQ08005.1 type II toxin-antitoxin system PemK/MazF family toxin [Sinorhizobium meliloti]MCK3786713.1 type II toxin-antitoxin system PemK/MazF family toxin [Sinorhizobium meliloti]MCK3792997.1 type II toxin-antitoxin system PemK/MazF family toxin [Sinorhizobium meliloti]MCK3799122.1 type II toxin-antitoxin system PemK/MazF family toxin [Sinorhizobium meliloti]
MIDKAMSVKREKLGPRFGRLDDETMLSVARSPLIWSCLICVSFGSALSEHFLRKSHGVRDRDKAGIQQANPIGIGGGRCDRAPATPPGMRVRTGRFEELRSGEAGDTEGIHPPEG